MHRNMKYDKENDDRLQRKKRYRQSGIKVSRPNKLGPSNNDCE